MAKRRPYKNITIHPAQGGALIGSASDDVPITQESNYLSSSANYAEKLNFRRETDGELRREGWELFGLGTNLKQYGASNTFDALDSQFPIRAIHQFPGTNGTPALVVIAGGKVWRLKTSEDTYAKNYLSPSQLYSTDNDGSEYWLAQAEDFYWDPIYTFNSYIDKLDENGNLLDPFKGGAYRWEIVDVQNHIIINNGVDLPVVYKSEWGVAEPLYSLRENGVVSCGTIGVFQDRLFCADLTVIVSGYDQLFESADPYGSPEDNILFQSGVVRTQRYQYRMVYSAEGEPKLFNSGIIAGSSVVMESGGLPGTLTVKAAGQYQFTFDYNYKIGTPGSMYQFYSQGVFQGDEAYTLNMVEPVPTIKSVDEKTNSLLVSGIFLSQGSSSSATDDAYAKDPQDPTTFYAIEYGADGLYGTIDDQEYEYFNLSSDYLLVDSNQDDLVLQNPETAQPFVVGNYTVVLRPYAEQLRSPAAFREFSQDGSRILKMKELADKLVVYRDSGFFFLSRTNSPEVPFAIEPRYKGGRVADFRHTIIDVDGKQHIFMGNSGIYSITRSSTEPKPINMFEIGPPFWQSVPPELSEYIYAVDNPITREVFINCPLGLLKNSKGDYVDQLGEVIYSDSNFEYASGVGLYADNANISGDQEYWELNVTSQPQPKLEWGTIAYDYINSTLSTIDASFTASSYIRKPKHNRLGPEEAWFLMGVHQANGGDFIYPGTQHREDYSYGGVLVRYGYGPPRIGEREPYRVYNRLGFGYESRLKSGLIDFGDSFSDKEVRSYQLELSSKYGTTPLRVKISTSSAPQGTEQIETMEVVDGKDIDYVELNNLVDENVIPMYVRAPYIRDEIIVTSALEYSDEVFGEDGYIESQEEFFATESPVVINNPIKVVGRTFEVSGIDSRSATQTYNQG